MRALPGGVRRGQPRVASKRSWLCAAYCSHASRLILVNVSLCQRHTKDLLHVASHSPPRAPQPLPRDLSVFFPTIPLAVLTVSLPLSPLVDGSKIPQVKFQEIVREGQSTIVSTILPGSGLQA